MQSGGSRFKLSMMILSRILDALLEESGMGRTAISRKTNTNYGRVSKHVEWLERKRLVEPVLVGGKVHIKLTKRGRDIAILFSDDSGNDVYNYVNKEYNKVSEVY